MRGLEFYALGACALFVALVALRQFARALRTKPSEGPAPILLLATAALLALAAVQLHQLSLRRALPIMDTASVRATFLGLTPEGPQRQLVFRYEVRNTASSDFVVDRAACALVSFRFLPGAKYDPASALLEKDNAAHERYTGLVRLPHQGMELRPCPLILKAGQSQDVAIAIPYAYPASFGSPEEANLRSYVRTTMRNVDGFGAAAAGGRRGILFPKGW